MPGYLELKSLLLRDRRCTFPSVFMPSCSEARITKRVRHRPGASPLLFGRFLMSLGAFVSLEDISDALPPYREEIVSVEMDQPLKEAYQKLEEEIKEALREHRGNQSVISVALN